MDSLEFQHARCRLGSQHLVVPWTGTRACASCHCRCHGPLSVRRGPRPPPSLQPHCCQHSGCIVDLDVGHSNANRASKDGSQSRRWSVGGRPGSPWQALPARRPFVCGCCGMTHTLSLKRPPVPARPSAVALLPATGRTAPTSTAPRCRSPVGLRARALSATAA